MHAEIEVKDRNEAKAIRYALADPDARAFIVITGTLLQLPTKQSRSRVLNFVTDYIEEQRITAERAELK